MIKLIVYPILLLSIYCQASLSKLIPGISYSYSYSLSNNSSDNYGVHTPSLYIGYPFVPGKTYVGLELGYNFSSLNGGYSYGWNSDGFSVTTDTTIVKYDKNYSYSFSRSRSYMLSAPIELYIGKFFINIAPGIDFSLIKTRSLQTIVWSSRLPDNTYAPYDTVASNYIDNFASNWPTFKYGVGYNTRFLQFLLIGQDLFYVGFSVRYKFNFNPSQQIENNKDRR